MSLTAMHVEGTLAERIEQGVLEPIADFQDPSPTSRVP